MNIRSFKNVVHIAETGSLTAAAANAHLTVQAIAAQLNKIEDHFGFALFKRTPKGMALTEPGRSLLPRIREVIKASSGLDEQIAEIRGQASKQLRIAMNTTLTQDAMARLLQKLMAVFSGFDIQFSAGETHENLRNLREQAVDLAVFLGPPTADVEFVDLDGFGVSVVSASTSSDALHECGQRKERFLVRPDSSCPYSEGFNQFVDEKLAAFDDDFIENHTIFSASEHLTVTLIRQLDGIGLLSRDIAYKNELAILPDFEVTLPVRLAVDPKKVDGVIGRRLRALGYGSSKDAVVATAEAKREYA